MRELVSSVAELNLGKLSNQGCSDKKQKERNCRGSLGGGDGPEAAVSADGKFRSSKRKVQTAKQAAKPSSNPSTRRGPKLETAFPRWGNMAANKFQHVASVKFPPCCQKMVPGRSRARTPDASRRRDPGAPPGRFGASESLSGEPAPPPIGAWLLEAWNFSSTLSFEL